MMVERLTARSPKNSMAYLINVKQNEQDVESPYPNTLRCIMDSFNRLAAYEDSGLSPEEVQEFAQANAEGRLVVLDERLAVSMCAGARAIEQNINRMGKRYVYDVLKLEPTIPYLEAARMLREAAEKALEGSE